MFSDSQAHTPSDRSGNRKKLQRWILPAAFVLTWLLGVTLLLLEVKSEQKERREAWTKGLALETTAKANSVSELLGATYNTIKTISLMPAVRAAQKFNRKSAAEDVVKMGRFPLDAALSLQLLYNHIADQVDVSEIYVIYEGFSPDKGEVPFLMFDEVLMERIAGSQKKAAVASGDRPEEYENDEYSEYVRQLSDMRQRFPTLPDTAPKGIGALVSEPLRTCDNSQYLSIAHGNVRDTQGILISVPVYDNLDRRFKGMVTAVIRTNVLEAMLIGWPRLPITRADQDALLAAKVDMNVVPASYVLENIDSGMRISDRRNTRLADNFEGKLPAGLHLVEDVRTPFSSSWKVHRVVDQSVVDEESLPFEQAMWVRVALFSAVLVGVWLGLSRRMLRVQFQSARQMKKLANFDALTGLPNRRLVTKRLTQSLELQKKQVGRVAVIMVDLDGFKEVNDTLGHQAGDALLIEVARRFSYTLRESDVVFRLGNDGEKEDTWDDTDLVNSDESLVGRLGGDEFLILLPQLPDTLHAMLVIERLQASLASPVTVGEETVYVHASMGLATSPDHGVDTVDLLRRADMAMYESKRKGHGNITVFAEDLDTRSIRRLRLVADLHTALRDNQFILHYQPILHLPQGRIEGVEALIRWQHPDLGLVAPAEFIPLLEQSGAILEVGNWVMRTACTQLRVWQDAGSPIRLMAINVSGRQLAVPDAGRPFLEIIDEVGVLPESIALEITESVLMQSSASTIELLQQLRGRGVKVAIDDFGTGYSSLSYLRTLPLDVLKIDRSFVVDSDNPTGLAICESLAHLARKLHFEVIAEGIETTEQLKLMMTVGANLIQGYYIARPLPAGQADEFARNFAWQPP